MISDPARPDSQIIIPIDPHWKQSRTVPDTYSLILALASPEGIKLIPELVEKARLSQATVTKELRGQARRAIRLFIQYILDNPQNRFQVSGDRFQVSGDNINLIPDTQQDTQHPTPDLAKQLWQEGLIIIYRLLFILKLETIDDNARLFRFASSSLWRNTFSPSTALAKYAREVLDKGRETGSLLEDGLRSLFRMFEQGIECTELTVRPLGGALFGTYATPILSQLQWGEKAIAHLLDQLLWTTPKKKDSSRERVHYGTLSVEDLGRVYEALLELESGIATERMCRLRRQKLEVVVPIAQGEKYRGSVGEQVTDEIDEEQDEDETTEKGNKKTKVEFIEEIAPGSFYLRAGLGRKSTGSYYTPNSFVRFLVQETLGELVKQCSPRDNPNPLAILRLKVLDSAMGSGQFLVEACRFLGDKLYEACRECDERVKEARQKLEELETKAQGLDFSSDMTNIKSSSSDMANIKSSQSDVTPTQSSQSDVNIAEHYGEQERSKSELEINKSKWTDLLETYQKRLIDLSDPQYNPESYLPSRSVEGTEKGVSEAIARAICRRLVAVHCLYGVDKNVLACQLAKLSLWLETHAEGLPLTFLDHRLVVGDSLTGPFFDHLLKYPGSQDDIDPIYKRGIREGFTKVMREALKYVKELEATVGIDLADLMAKQRAKMQLDRVLAPLKIVAAAWSGGVMLGGENCDDVAYSWLLQTIGETGDLPADLGNISGFGLQDVNSDHSSKLLNMIAKGLGVNSVPSQGEALCKLVCGDRFQVSDQLLGVRDQVSDQLLGVRDQVSDQLLGVRDQVSDQLLGVRDQVSGDNINLIPDTPYPTPDTPDTLPVIPALPYDLTFAEVFYPDGNLDKRNGFDVILGNPPWDAIQFKSKEFLASFNITIMDAPTKRERDKIEKELMLDPNCASLFQRYKEEFEEQKRVNDALYKYQKVRIEGDLAGRQLDAFRVFMERNEQLLKPFGLTGVVIPSGFHANEGATGIRRLYLENMALKCCYSFENRRKLFEIHLSFKFAAIIAQKGSITREFPCAFYLHDDEWLFDKKDRKPLNYTLDFVRKTGGEYLSLLELQSEKDLEVAKICFANGEPFGQVCEKFGIKLGRECDMSNDAWRFTPTDEILSQYEDPRDPIILERLINKSFVMLHDDKTYEIYSDLTRKWRPRYLVSLEKIKDKLDWLQKIPFFRISYRKITGATNSRTCIVHLLPSGYVFGDGTYCDRQAGEHNNLVSLLVLSVLASFTFDWSVRLKTLANLNLFIIYSCPFPIIEECKIFLTHCALRLTCNHQGYDPLWKEQIGDIWREPNKEPFTYPILGSDEERWQVIAQIDAVIAQAYGLNREQYAHVLSTFSHKSYPNAPQLCLMYFDELRQIGLEQFTQKYDPYYNIPVPENLPKPVIQLPTLTPETEANTSKIDENFQLTPPPSDKPKRRRKK